MRVCEVCAGVLGGWLFAQVRSYTIRRTYSLFLLLLLLPLSFLLLPRLLQLKVMYAKAWRQEQLRQQTQRWQLKTAPSIFCCVFFFLFGRSDGIMSLWRICFEFNFAECHKNFKQTSTAWCIYTSRGREFFFSFSLSLCCPNLQERRWSSFSNVCDCVCVFVAFNRHKKAMRLTHVVVRWKGGGWREGESCAMNIDWGFNGRGTTTMLADGAGANFENKHEIPECWVVWVGEGSCAKGGVDFNRFNRIF